MKIWIIMAVPFLSRCKTVFAVVDSHDKIKDLVEEAEQHMYSEIEVIEEYVM